MIRFEIDTRALVYTLELLLVAGVIAVSAQFAAREIVAWSVLPPPEDVALAPLADLPDENAFYLEPPTAAPVFLADDAMKKKRQALVWEKRDFLAVDIDRGTIARYAGGAVQAEYPLLSSAGGEGFLEAPQGLYTVQGKAERHFSQIGRRYFPWAIYLYGNYLIHADAAAKGGGIRVAASHARDLYAHAAEGMPVLVLRENSPSDITFTYARKNNLPHRVPEVTAAAALAADLETGEALFEKNKNDAYPTASLTKLMTAVVATEEIEPQRILTVTDDALRTYGDSGGLVRGETFRAADLLRGLILASSNDAAAVYQAALPDFLARLNDKAEALGMHKTFFDDASGLSGENVTSAENLLLLLRYMQEKHPSLLSLSREPAALQQSENKKKRHVWSNINWPRGDARYMGGKAGFTDDSLQTMAGIWNVRVSEYGGRKIAVALLGSRNRVRDVRALIGYLEQDFIYGFAFDADKDTSKPAAEQASIDHAMR
ncbi:MAG: serine hydrolase [Patescibacteria group bacterium]